MVLMILLGLGMHDSIVHANLAKGELGGGKLGHNPLERSWAVAKTHWHDGPLRKACCNAEGCLTYIILLHADIVKTISQANASEDLGVTHVVK